MDELHRHPKHQRHITAAVLLRLEHNAVPRPLRERGRHGCGGARDDNLCARGVQRQARCQLECGWHWCRDEFHSQTNGVPRWIVMHQPVCVCICGVDASVVHVRLNPQHVRNQRARALHRSHEPVREAHIGTRQVRRSVEGERHARRAPVGHRRPWGRGRKRWIRPHRSAGRAGSHRRLCRCWSIQRHGRRWSYRNDIGVTVPSTLHCRRCELVCSGAVVAHGHVHLGAVRCTEAHAPGGCDSFRRVSVRQPRRHVRRIPTPKFGVRTNELWKKPSSAEPYPRISERNVTLDSRRCLRPIHQCPAWCVCE